MRSDRSGRVAAVVPAAGLSRRMGRNKLLLKLEGVPVVARTVRSAIAAGLDPVIVVVGHDADRVEEALQGLNCSIVTNPAYEDGKDGSVRRGLTAVPGDAIAAAILLPDMPLVTAGMMKSMVERYRKGSALLVVSRYGDVDAPPMIHDRTLFAELLAPGAQGCGKRVLQSHRREALFIDWPASALADLDVPADYERLAGQPAPR